MNCQSKIFLVAFLTAVSSFAVDSQFYYCTGTNLEFIFLHALDDNEHFLDVEFAGATIKMTAPTVIATDYALYIVAQTKPTQKRFSFEVMLPIPQQKGRPNCCGIVPYPQFKTLVTFNGDGAKQHEVNCEIFGLTEKFFDEIAACIP